MRRSRDSTKLQLESSLSSVWRPFPPYCRSCGTLTTPGPSRMLRSCRPTTRVTLAPAPILLEAQQRQAAPRDADAERVNFLRTPCFFTSSILSMHVAKSPMISGYLQPSSCLGCSSRHIQTADSAQNCLKAAAVLRVGRHSGGKHV